MRPHRYDFKKFIELIEDLDYHEMILNIEKEALRLESGLFPGRGGRRTIPNDERDVALNFLDELKRLAFFLRTGRKPMGTTRTELSLYEGICKKLINKEQLKPSILEIFKGSK